MHDGHGYAQSRSRKEATMKIAREVKLAFVSFLTTCVILVGVDQAAAGNQGKTSLLAATPVTAATNG